LQIRAASETLAADMDVAGLPLSAKRTSKHTLLNRRRFLVTGLAVPALTLPGLAYAASERRLRFHHTHTNEKLDIVYRDAAGPRPDALARINNLLRDHRSGEVVAMDTALLDILSDLYDGHGRTGRFEVISGYRSPATNEQLRSHGSGVAKKSLHMQGKAIDIRLTSVATAELRAAALELGGGGVGYYAQSDFIHVDTGRVRHW
jgi:uncharacterized protein YcbK (DUF882 family)